VNVSGSLVFKSSLLTAAGFLALCLSSYSQDKPAPPETSAPAADAPDSVASPASPASFAYDVVSIKPFKPGVPGSVNSSADGLEYRGVGLLELLINAFPTLTLDQLVGVPDWADASRMNAERFDVEAKMDENTAGALKKLPWDQQQEIRRSMMLQVLADRCKLKYHKESHEMPIYNLVVAKNGPKFKETPAGKEDNWIGGFAEISGDNIEMKQLPGMLSGFARRYVVDKTGLTGKYSFSLKWNPLDDQNTPAWFADQYPQFKGRPDIFIALEQQLGLKLEPAKGPVDVYVIDHVEQPSPN